MTNHKKVEVVVCFERVFTFSSAASIVLAMSRACLNIKFFSVSNLRCVASCSLHTHLSCNTSVNMAIQCYIYFRVLHSIVELKVRHDNRRFDVKITS